MHGHTNVKLPQGVFSGISLRRPVWTSAENLAPTGIRSPNRPARSELLYGLIYSVHSGNRIQIILCRYQITLLIRAQVF